MPGTLVAQCCRRVTEKPRVSELERLAKLRFHLSAVIGFFFLCTQRSKASLLFAQGGLFLLLSNTSAVEQCHYVIIVQVVRHKGLTKSFNSNKEITPIKSGQTKYCVRIEHKRDVRSLESHTFKALHKQMSGTLTLQTLTFPNEIHKLRRKSPVEILPHDIAIQAIVEQIGILERVL